MNRQSWSFEVLIGSPRRMKPSQNWSLSTASMTGLKLPKNLEKPTTLPNVLGSSAGNGGITISILQLTKNPGAITRKSFSLSYTRSMETVGKIFLAISLAGKFDLTQNG